uniref:Uncharacterized protein n=1 Tax=Kalanchoe fedtschenkoi TaxID=63787 RepID=A0A7N0UDD4_KALFE
MASRQSLRKIGEEAFKLIDQAEEKHRFLYHPAKPITVRYLQQQTHMSSHAHKADQFPPQGQHTGYYHVQVIPAPVADKEQDHHGSVMDCYEAARRFGGVVSTDYYPNKRIAACRNNRAY